MQLSDALTIRFQNIPIAQTSQMARYHADLTRLIDKVLTGPGTTPPELRHAVESRAAALSGRQDVGVVELPDELMAWVDKVAQHAYRTTDEDIESLKAAGYSENQLFEVTVAAALGASRARLERALQALRSKNRGGSGEA